MGYLKNLLLISLTIFLFGCEKSLLKPNSEKIEGDWILDVATLYVEHTVDKFGNGNFVKNTVVTEYSENELINLLQIYGASPDLYKKGDRFNIQRKEISTRIRTYGFNFLDVTNHLEISIPGSKRIFQVTKLSSNTLILESKPSVPLNLSIDNNSIRQNFTLKFKK